MLQFIEKGFSQSWKNVKFNGPELNKYDFPIIQGFGANPLLT